MPTADPTASATTPNLCGGAAAGRQPHRGARRGTQQPPQKATGSQPPVQPRQAQDHEPEEAADEQAGAQPAGTGPEAGWEALGEVARTAEYDAGQPHRAGSDSRDQADQQLPARGLFLSDAACPVTARAVEAGDSRATRHDVADGRGRQRDAAEPAPPNPLRGARDRTALLHEGAQNRQRLRSQRQDQPPRLLDSREVGRLQRGQLRYDEGQQCSCHQPLRQAGQHGSTPMDQPLPPVVGRSFVRHIWTSTPPQPRPHMSRATDQLVRPAGGGVLGLAAAAGNPRAEAGVATDSPDPQQHGML